MIKLYVCRTIEDFKYLQKKYIDIGYKWNHTTEIFIPKGATSPLILHVDPYLKRLGWDMYGDLFRYENNNQYKTIYFNLREEKLNRILK